MLTMRQPDLNNHGYCLRPVHALIMQGQILQTFYIRNCLYVGDHYAVCHCSDATLLIRIILTFKAFKKSMLNIIIPFITMLRVIMLNIFMLTVIMTVFLYTDCHCVECCASHPNLTQKGF
jgi:hypothetical protein